MLNILRRFRDRERVKIRHGFGKVTVVTESSTQTIHTKGLLGLVVRDTNEMPSDLVMGVSSAVLWAKYQDGSNSQLGYQAIAGFQTVQAAETVRMAVSRHGGVSIAKRVFKDLIPVLLMLLALDLVYTALRSTPSPTSALSASAAAIPYAPPESDAQAKLDIASQLKAELAQYGDLPREGEYAFNPKLATPAIAPPSLKCAPGANSSVAQQASK